MDANEQVDEFFVPDKEDGYVYKWCNTRERVIMQRHRQGYEVVDKPEEIPDAVKKINPQPADVPTSVVRRRGDLVLMRIKKDVWERNVAGPIRANKERHRISAEAMLEQANDAARRALRRHGIPDSQIPRRLIDLDSTPEPVKDRR